MTWIGIGNTMWRRGGGSAFDWSSYWTTHFVWGLRTMVVSNSSIKLDWVNYGNNEVSVERSADGVTYVEIDTVAAGIETFTDTGLSTATDYWYRIRPFSGSNYGDYCAAQADRTLPVSDKYPFVETTNWHNENHAIRDIRLYVPDASETYMMSQCGFDGTVYKLTITRQSDDAEIVNYTFNTASYFDKTDWVKLDLSRRDDRDVNVHGYIVVNIGNIIAANGTPNSIGYAWQMPSNEPNIVASCIIQAADPVQTLGTTLMITPSKVVSDVNSLYAHESSVYVDDDVLLVAYNKNLVSGSEDNVAEAAILVTVDKTDLSVTEQIIAKSGAIYGGMNFSVSTPVVIPRIYKLLDGTIRIYFGYNSLCYYRDYDVATNTLGTTTEFKAIISGGAEPVSLTAANLQAHCEAVSETTKTYFNSLRFLFRDTERFYDNGDGNLYCAGELTNGLPASFSACFPVFMKSSDGGATWELQGIAYLPELTGSIPYYLETNTIYYSGKWYFVCREGNYVNAIAESSDDGRTWGNFNLGSPALSIGYNFPISNIGLRSSIKKYGNTHILAYSHRRLEYRAANHERSALAISYIIDKMGNNRLRAIANNDDLIHYPSIAVNGKYLYLAYTTAELSGGGQDSLKNTIRLVKIALTDL